MINRSTERSRLSIAFFYEPDLAMEMPEGIGLEREGKNSVKTYGEHYFRSFASSYPETDSPTLKKYRLTDNERLI